MLAVSSLSTYGILLAGWSANSKYAFLGSLRSTAQLISYELILSSAILLVILLTGSLNLTVNIEAQRAVWFIMPLFPIFIIFFIGSVAETNRAPFDLAEAESELVSGFMTEHAAVIFVFFFLAEYASIVLICILTSILFLGGYLLNYLPILYLIQEIDYRYIFIENLEFLSDPLIEGLWFGISIGLKTCIMIFIFIWVRASFPRIRFDQLMTFCWTILLPIVIGLIILVPCILYSFEILPTNISLLYLPFMVKNRRIKFMTIKNLHLFQTKSFVAHYSSYRFDPFANNSPYRNNRYARPVTFCLPVEDLHCYNNNSIVKEIFWSYLHYNTKYSIRIIFRYRSRRSRLSRNYIGNGGKRLAFSFKTDKDIYKFGWFIYQEIADFYIKHSFGNNKLLSIKVTIIKVYSNDIT